VTRAIRSTRHLCVGAPNSGHRDSRPRAARVRPRRRGAVPDGVRPRAGADGRPRRRRVRRRSGRGHGVRARRPPRRGLRERSRRHRVVLGDEHRRPPLGDALAGRRGACGRRRRAVDGGRVVPARGLADHVRPPRPGNRAPRRRCRLRRRPRRRGTVGHRPARRRRDGGVPPRGASRRDARRRVRRPQPARGVRRGARRPLVAPVGRPPHRRTAADAVPAL